MDDFAELKEVVDTFSASTTEVLAQTTKDVKELRTELDKVRLVLNRPGAAAVHRGGASDLARYSPARAIKMADGGRFDGFEAEMHAELSKGRETRGIAVPTAILLGGERKAQLVTPDPAAATPSARSLAASPISSARRSASRRWAPRCCAT
jgi:hypothetical protein